MVDIADARKNTAALTPGLPFLYPVYGGIAGAAPPSTSANWFTFLAQGDPVDKAVLTSWGSTQLQLSARLRNLALSDPDEYWMAVSLFDIGTGGRISATQTDAVTVSERGDVVTISKTFNTSVLTTDGPFGPAWMYHVDGATTPGTAAPDLELLGFHVQQA